MEPAQGTIAKGDKKAGLMDWRFELFVWVPFLAKKLELKEPTVASWLGEMVKRCDKEYEWLVDLLNEAAADHVVDLRAYVTKAVDEKTERRKIELSEMDKENLRRLKAGDVPAWWTQSYVDYLREHGDLS